MNSSVDRTSALRSVRRKLEELSRGVFKRCRVRKPFLAYVPFWLLSCRVDGYVFGVKPVYREHKIKAPVENEEGRTGSTIIRTIKQRKGVRAEEHQISHGIDIIVSAANLEPLGIPSLGRRSQMALSGMALGRSGASLPLSVFDSRELPGDASIVDPCVPLSRARVEAEEFVTRLCDGVGVGLEQRSSYLAVTGNRERLVHYPLWTVDYSMDGNEFRIIVDGVTGNVLRGRFPADAAHWERVTRILGSIWAGLFPIILLVIFSGLLSVGPVLMVFLLSIWGLGAVSVRFLNLAGRHAGRDSHV